MVGAGGAAKRPSRRNRNHYSVVAALSVTMILPFIMG
jgi:hypothetical protein